MAEPRATEMSRHWDEFARSDPRYYIATQRGAWATSEFLESGRAVVANVVSWIGADAGRDRALEIGCGLGRHLLHFADHFRVVEGLDVSAEMIERARGQSLPANVSLHVGSGADLRGFDAGVFDLVFSTLVFQHIPDEAVIASYLAETRRVLASNGRAVLQFDTRIDGVWLRLYKSLPDRLLPRPHRRYIRRYRRRADRIRTLLAAAGLHVVDEGHPVSPDHVFLLAGEHG